MPNTFEETTADLLSDWPGPFQTLPANFDITLKESTKRLLWCSKTVATKNRAYRTVLDNWRGRCKNSIFAELALFLIHLDFANSAKNTELHKKTRKDVKSIANSLKQLTMLRKDVLVPNLYCLETELVAVDLCLEFLKNSHDILKASVSREGKGRTSVYYSKIAVAALGLTGRLLGLSDLAIANELCLAIGHKKSVDSMRKTIARSCSEATNDLKSLISKGRQPGN